MMRSYTCEDVVLSDKNTIKGWLCNPEEEGKKPAVIVLGPRDSKDDKISMRYATRLANYGYVTLCLEETENIKAAIDYLSFKEEVDASKMYAVGICHGTNEVINRTGEEQRLKAIALVSGCYKKKEASQLKTPTIIIHGGENESLESAQEVYETIKAEDKMAIWEDSFSRVQYYEDPLVLDKTVKNVYRWFNTH